MMQRECYSQRFEKRPGGNGTGGGGASAGAAPPPVSVRVCLSRLSTDVKVLFVETTRRRLATRKRDRTSDGVQWRGTEKPIGGKRCCRRGEGRNGGPT